MLSLNYEVYVNGDSVGSCRCVLCVVCYVPVEAGGRRQASVTRAHTSI